MPKRDFAAFLSMDPRLQTLHSAIEVSACFCRVGVSKWKTKCKACAPVITKWTKEVQVDDELFVGKHGLFRFSRLFMLVMKHAPTFVPKSLLVDNLPSLILEHRGLNFFITGQAGTGKSYTFMEIAKLLESEGINYGLAAPTGAAAIRINGVTLHALFGLKPWDPQNYKRDRIGFPRKFAKSLTKKDYLKEILERWKTIQVLLIDEVSMVNPELLEVIDGVARHIRKCADTAYGGIQIVFSGDFLQLPPVPEKGGSKVPFCFQHESWKDVHITVLLTENKRQQGDLRFQNALNELRMGNCSLETEEVIRECQMKPLPTDIDTVDWTSPSQVLRLPVHLFPTNKQVDAYNSTASSRNLHEPIIFTPRVKWYCFNKKTSEPKPGATMVQFDEKKLVECEPPDESDTVELYYTDSTVHRLKPQTYRIGSLCELQVNKFDHELCNGSLFTITGTRPSKAKDIAEIPVGLFKNETEIPISPIRHTQWIGGTIGKFIAVDYLPFSEAFGLTIHKAQGQTYEEVCVHLAGTFAPGQAYIALSRCTSLKGMVVTGFQPRCVHADPDALRYYQELK